MLGDSSPLPKCGSASLTFRWLLLFVEIGLKTAARFSFFFCSQHFTTYLNHAHPFPSVSPILQDKPAAPHGYLYTAERELMDEFQMCFPRVWEDVSISRLGENAPCGPWESSLWGARAAVSIWLPHLKLVALFQQPAARILHEAEQMHEHYT